MGNACINIKQVSAELINKISEKIREATKKLPLYFLNRQGIRRVNYDSLNKVKEIIDSITADFKFENNKIDNNSIEILHTILLKACNIDPIKNPAMDEFIRENITNGIVRIGLNRIFSIKYSRKPKSTTRLNVKLNSLFTKDMDYTKFLNEYKRHLIKRIFISDNLSAIKSNKQFSDNLLTFRNDLIKELKQKVLDRLNRDLQVNKNDQLFILYKIDKLNNLNFLSINKNNSYSQNLALNILFEECEKMFSDLIVENKFDGSSRKVSDFKKFIMARDFDTFVNEFTDGNIRTRLGMFNSLQGHPNGKYIVNIGSDMKFTYSDDTLDFREYSNKLIPLYLSTIQILKAPGQYITLLDLLSIISYLHNKMPNLLFDVRNNPDSLADVFSRVLTTMQADKSVRVSIKNAAQSLYDALFNKEQAGSLYNIFKREGNIKYNLYTMLLNYINSMTTAKYLLTTVSKKGDTSVEQIENAITSRYARGIKENFMILSSMRSFDQLSQGTGILPIFKNDKLSGFSFKIGDKEYEISFITNDKEGDTYIMTSNQRGVIIQNKDKTLIVKHEDFLRKFNELTGSSFDRAFFDFMLNEDSSDSGLLFDLMLSSILNTYVSDKILNEISDNLTIDLTLDVVNSKLAFKLSSNNIDINLKSLDFKKSFYIEGAITLISKANAALNSRLHLSFIIDANGKKLPNMTLTSAGNDDAIIHEKLRKRVLAENDWLALNPGRKPLYSVPFVYNLFNLSNILEGTYIDLNVVNLDGDIKSVSTMTSAELCIHDFINRYLLNMDNFMYMQPMVYSDKSRIWVKRINLETKINLYGDDNFIDKTLNDLSVEEIHQLHIASMSRQYDVYTLNFVNSLELVANKLNINLGYNNDDTIQDKYIKLKTALNGVLYLDFIKAIEKVKNDGYDINVFYEALYHIKNGVIQFDNALFDYFNYIYKNKDAYDQKLNIERKLYVQALLKDGIKLYTSDLNGNINQSINSLYNKLLNEGKTEWVNQDTKEVILFKTNNNSSVIDDSVVYDDNVVVEFNPYLERYFSLNMLLSDNYNAMLYGYPYGHKGTGKISVFDSLRLNDPQYIRLLKEDESARTIQENKRGVIGGATITPFKRNSLNGIPSTYRVAVIKDVSLPIFNMLAVNDKGKNGASNCTVTDGAIWCNPIIALLEQNSISEINTGSIHKKPICHFDRTNIGLAGLLKCATFSLNNAYLRDSIPSDNSGTYIDTRRILRKMIGANISDELLEKVDFSIDRLDNYYYKDKNDFLDYRITHIRKIDSNTYTRHKIDMMGISSFDTIKINSLYDVWEMLGGELSKTMIDNNLVFSEGSIEELTKLINNNYFVKEEYKYKEASLPKTQEYYDLPLKKIMIDYLANESAVKSGISNMNPTEIYYKDLLTSTNESINNLLATEIDTLFLGVLLSAEHDISDTEISEMTLVISALEQKGLRHNSVFAIYNNIGKNIAKLLKPYIKDIDNEKSYSDLYNILGRKLVQIFATGNQGLTQAYIQAVQEDVEQNKSLSELIRKIPFNDPNVSNALQTGFTSGVNRSIIRRTYNGLAAVQAPSYDMITMFEGPDGRMYKYSELVNSCNSQEELLAKLESFDRFVTDPSEVFIEDYILIYDENGLLIKEGKVQGYENLNDGKFGLKDVLDLRGKNYQIKILGSKGRNLRSLNYLFEINLNDRVQKLCLYDLDNSILAFRLKNIFDASTATNYDDFLKSIKKTDDWYRIVRLLELMKIYSDTSFANAITKYLQNKTNTNYDYVHGFIVQGLLNDLDRISTKHEIDIPVVFNHNKKKITKAEIFNVIQSPNEIMIGRLLALKFGIEPGDQINDILSEGYFESKLQRLNHNPVDSSIKYDLLFTRLNGNHLYVITDQEVFEDLIANEEIIQYKPLTSYENGLMVKIDNNDIEYLIHKSYQFATYSVPGTGETMEFVYVPSDRVGKLIKDVESTNNYASLRVNPRLKNLNIINKAVNSSRTINKQVKELFNSNDTYEEKLIEFNNTSDLYYDNENIIEANKLRRSFELFLNFIGTRIPSQSMQSFMNMKVVGFVDTDSNLIWHNPALIVWTGSDFDIDKIYMLGCGISDNGVYEYWSDLFDFSSPGLFKLSNQLDLPIEVTGKTINLAELHKVIGEDDLAGAAMEYLNPTPESTETIFNGDINKHKEFYFLKIVNAINYLTRNNLRLNVGQEEDAEYSQALQLLIDTHFNTSLFGRRELESLKNKIYFDMIYNGDDVVNWIMQTTPITMSDALNAASNSVEGAYSKQLSNFNPYAKFVALFLNSIGKQGIGIFATGIKVWSMISTYFNDLYLNNPDSTIGGYNTDTNGVFKGFDKNGNPLQLSQFRVIPNLNFLLLMASSNEERKAMLKEQYERGYIPLDVYATLSTLLSAATDNAKELILEKINASPELAGIYIYMLMTGIHFKDASDFMIHPIISKVVNKSRKNIFDLSTQYRNIPNAIKYYLNGVNINTFINNNDYAKGLQVAFKEVTGKSLSDILFSSPRDVKNYIDKFLASDIFTSRSWRFKRPAQTNDILTEFGYDDDFGNELMNEFEYEDLIDDDFEYFSRETVDYNIMVKRYFLEVLSRANDIASVDLILLQQNLLTLQLLHTAARELTIIGRGGSLNQGIKTLFTEKISFETGIEKFIDDLIKLNVKKIPLELIPYANNFDLVRYCNDEEYRKTMINIYEYAKNTFNVLAIWDGVPHFKQMFRTYGMTDRILNTYIPVLYGKKKEICKRYIANKWIKNNNVIAFKKIDRYLQDLIAYKFLTLFDGKIIISKGSKIYLDNKIVTTPVDKELNFSNHNDIATFKLYMEDVVFKKLKQLNSGNYFVNNILLDKGMNDYGQQYTFMKAPLNSDYNDNEANDRLYNELLYGFNKIAYSNTPGLEMNILDAFALYNIITNSNRTNSNTFSKLLVESIKDPSSILVLYSNFVANSDNYSDLTINDDELLFRIIPYNELVNGLEKKIDHNRQSIKYIKEGKEYVFTSLNNAIKLPYVANTIIDIDSLLDNNILGRIIRLASLNKFELKLKCDD